MNNVNKKRNSLIAAIALVAAFVVFAALAVTAMAKNTGIAPSEVRKSVLFVVSIISDANTGETLAAGTGTGWAVGRPGEPVQYIITNGHVVQYAYEYPKAEPDKYAGNIQVYFSAAENDMVKPQVVFYSPPSEKDIAILKLPTPTDKRQALVLRRSRDVVAGDTAYALGFPGVSNLMQQASDVRYDIEDVTVTRGVISKRVFAAGTTFEAFQMDVAINHGNSGGPLVDERGFVLGVNTLGLNLPLDEAGQVTVGPDVNYASVADHLIRILEEERIAHTVKGESDWMIYMFTPLSVISLLGAGFMLKQSGKLEAKAAGAKGGKAGTGPSGAGRQPILRGVTGKYAGEKFDIKAAKLTLGRDKAQCNIVFDPNTPGISANHCSVYYDANTECFMLVDNGSSYGTFLGNGKKLTANVPERLSIGDSFYLADTGNRFVASKE